MTTDQELKLFNKGYDYAAGILLRNSTDETKDDMVKLLAVTKEHNAKIVNWLHKAPYDKGVHAAANDYAKLLEKLL